jgi:cardiolipin synthase (CMP-forming)
MFAEDLLRELRRAGYSPAAILGYVRAITSRAVLRVPMHAESVRSVAATALALFALQFAVALYFSATFGRNFGVSYLVASSALLLLACFWVLAHLGLLVGPGSDRIMRQLPLPVAITMLRLVALPAIVLFVLHGMWWVAVWAFLAIALTDVLDGVVARALAMESRTGKVLDPMVDIVFNVTIFVTMAQVGQIPWWVAGLVVGRYALLVFGTFYLYIFRGPVRIEPTGFGKLTGVFTTCLVGLLLFGLAVWSEATRQQLRGVFDVALGVLAMATIIQVVFIGLANRRSLTPPRVKVVIAPADAPAKVVGEIRGPRV